MFPPLAVRVANSASRTRRASPVTIPVHVPLTLPAILEAVDGTERESDAGVASASPSPGPNFANLTSSSHLRTAHDAPWLKLALKFQVQAPSSEPNN